MLNAAYLGVRSKKAMGSYSENLKYRVSTRGPREGYCVICGGYGELARDHVPPKGCNNVRDHELRVFQADGAGKGRTSQGGTHFRTLCATCNSHRLGLEYDPELIKFSNAVVAYAVSKSTGKISLPNDVLVSVKPQRLARSVIGHALAAVAVDEAANGLLSAPFPDALRAYFLDENASLPDELEIYYWLYPSRRQVIVKGAMKMSFRHRAGVMGHIFKFLPFGFWLVWERPSEVSIDLPRLLRNRSMGLDEMAQVAISINNIPHLEFPEAPENDEAIMLNTEATSVATPKGEI